MQESQETEEDELISLDDIAPQTPPPEQQTTTKEQPTEITQERRGENIEVIESYEDSYKKREVKDFVDYFRARYFTLQKHLQGRHELQNLSSISRVLNKNESDNISIIAMVTDIHETKNQNIILTLEDPTGQIKALISKSKTEVFNRAKSIVHDEVIGIVGKCSDRFIFADNFLVPDIPSGELKKAPDEAYAIFLSDIHVGSNNFLDKKFEKFLAWLNGDTGTEKHKELVKKIKYVFIVGDLVDGVGIYPGQEEELVIPDVCAQYEEMARYLKMIPKDMQIIICPGNHDAVRLAEPQPSFDKEFSGALWDVPNITITTNPATINIHKSKDFPGFNVLLYHGYSFDYYVANVDTIRNAGGYDRADLIMAFLLQRRHLAPTHASSPYIPEATKDPLIITTVPDFFITGHIHKASASNYKTTTLLCGSCWQAKTSFQEKVGHHPDPAHVPLVNLQTRKIKMLKF